MAIRWSHMTADEFHQATDSVVILGIGSLEQHSGHLPVGTDTLILSAILEQTASYVNSKIIILPVLPFGFSPHHLAFPGCITLRQDTIRYILEEICSGVYNNGFTKIIILNSHGGNQTSIQATVNELGEKRVGYPIALQYWSLIADEIQNFRTSEVGGMGHAGEFETSLMMHYYPELVREGNIAETEPAKGSKWHNPDMFARNIIYRYREFDKYSKTGIIGQPQFASAEKGKAIAQRICKRLAELIDYTAENNF